VRIAAAVAFLLTAGAFPSAAQLSSHGQPPAADTAPAPPLIVTYDHGRLSIDAHDATLRDILDKIASSTGAAVEAPLLDERITIHLPPQPPAQAVAALLQGLPLSYAILGGTRQQEPVHRIILTRNLPAVQLSASDVEEAAAVARARAMLHAAQTGGDEGVWDNEPESPPPSPRHPDAPRPFRPSPPPN
jgi:hypothetical protein